MTPVGERLEHAIESRTEIAQELEHAEAQPSSARKLGKTIFWLTITGISLYLVAPSLIETFGSWNELNKLSPAWLVAMAVLQALSLACVWALQRLALHRPAWPPVISSQLAGNALAEGGPRGGAVGAAPPCRGLRAGGGAEAARR